MSKPNPMAPPREPGTDVPIPHLEEAPALSEAGGHLKDARRRTAEHHQAAELVARLEILRTMYKSLMSCGVGTNMIEAESSKLVKERLVGPTGHRLLLIGSEGVDSAVTESELTKRVGLHSWRDPAMVRRLTGIRMKVVSRQLKQAREVLSKELRFISTTKGKVEIGRSWQDTRDIRKQVWVEEHPRTQRKINHLMRRAKECGIHK